jgi:thiol-disulfide isomerase/thioredoxin
MALRRLVLPLAVLLVAQLMIGSSVIAQELPSRPASPTRYHHHLTRAARETFDKIARYCREQPDAPDRLTAVQDLCTQARIWGWEADARSLVESTLCTQGLSSLQLREMLAVVALGAARAGDRDASVSAFEKFLRSLRLRNPNEATDLAQSLALVWQLRGDREAAAGVYELVAGAFFLNPEVKDFAAARTTRLDLLGQPPPGWPEADLSGRVIPAVDFAGKVVLLDFWATNCRPCLEELPRLRQLHRDCVPHGLEIVGFGFDEDRVVLDQFLLQEPIPWRLTLARTLAEDRYHVSLIPCLMLMDRQGKIVATDVRPFDLRRTVELLLDRQP